MDDRRILRGQIRYIEPTQATGSEQRGGRPAIIVSNNVGNLHAPIVIVVYITASKKKPLPTHVPIQSVYRTSTALCEQVDTVAKERVGRIYASASKEEMAAIDKALLVSLGISVPDSNLFS